VKSLGISGTGRFKFSYAPWLQNEFVKSYFIEDTRKWEHIPLEEITIYKGSSCGASEALVNDWQKMWDRKQRDQEALNNYMEDLKSKYPDWR